MIKQEESLILHERLKDTAKSLYRLGVREAVFKLPTKYVDKLMKPFKEDVVATIVEELPISMRSIGLYGVKIYFEDIK